MIFPADLHLHSYYSDGSDSPQQIIDQACEQGLKAISITDHDYATWTPQLSQYAAKRGIELLPGIEISCQDETTQRKVHLLAYFLAEKHPHVDALIKPFGEKITAQRFAMIELLQQKGYPISSQDVQIYMHQPVLFKQHIALALAKKGIDSYSHLYQQLFRDPERFLETHYPPPFIAVKDAIEAVLQDNGIPVLAHPRSYNSFDQIEKYLHWGLKGIEISHPSFRDGDLERIWHYPLLHTGGSDYHGQYNLSNLRQIGHYGISMQDLSILKEVKQS